MIMAFSTNKILNNLLWVSSYLKDPRNVSVLPENKVFTHFTLMYNEVILYSKEDK